MKLIFFFFVSFYWIFQSMCYHFKLIVILVSLCNSYFFFVVPFNSNV